MGARGPCPPLAPLLALALLALAGPARALQNVTAQLFGPEARGTLAAFGDFNSDKQTDLFVLRGGECAAGAGGRPGALGVRAVGAGLLVPSQRKGTAPGAAAPVPRQCRGRRRARAEPGAGAALRCELPGRERGWLAGPCGPCGLWAPGCSLSPRARPGGHSVVCRVNLTLALLPGISCVSTVFNLY